MLPADVVAKSLDFLSLEDAVTAASASKSLRSGYAEYLKQFLPDLDEKEDAVNIFWKEPARRKPQLYRDRVWLDWAMDRGLSILSENVEVKQLYLLTQKGGNLRAALVALEPDNSRLEDRGFCHYLLIPCKFRQLLKYKNLEGFYVRYRNQMRFAGLE